MIDSNNEEFLTLISKKLVGADLLYDINYDIVDLKGDMVVLSVNGNVSEMIDETNGRKM